jgi:hypothetical protein
LGMSPGVGAIAAPHLAVHDRRANGLLGAPVGGIDRRIDQEPVSCLP